MFIHKIPTHTAAMSALPYNSALHEQYKFVATDGTPVDMAVRHGDRLLVPRATMPIGEVDNRVSFKPFVQSIACKPRDAEQEEIISGSINRFRTQPNGDHVIQAVTGAGKTVMACMVAATLGQPTLIIVPKQDLIWGKGQWRDTLTQLVGVKHEHIGIIQQDKCDYQGKRFVLGMLQSLSIPDRYPEIMRIAFGMMIIDELHRVGSDHFKAVCGMFPARYRLGLSATPTRWDGMHRMIHAHMGPVAFAGRAVPMKAKILVKKTGWKVPKGWQKDDEGQWIKTTMNVTPGRMMPIIKKLAECPKRNALLADFVIAAFKAGRRTVVMSDLIDGHLVPLFHLFGSMGVPGEEMGYYIGGKKTIELEIAKSKRVVLATYLMVKEGTNVPIWDTLAFGTPRSDIKQAIGRILRSMEGKKQPTALDLVDDNPVLQGFFKAREGQYCSIGADIVHM